MRQLNTTLSVDPEAELPKVEKLLYSLAWGFAQKYGLNFDEAKSNSYLGFMKACRNYKPGKGMKFSSWCRLVTWGQHMSLVMQRASKHIETIELNDEIVGEPAYVNQRTLQLCETAALRGSLSSTLCRLLREAPAEMIEVAEGLSEEGQEMLLLFMEAPEELIQDRTEEVEHLLKQFAQSHGKEVCRRTFREIYQSFANAFA